MAALGRSGCRSASFHGVTTNPILLEAAGVPCTLPTLDAPRARCVRSRRRRSPHADLGPDARPLCRARPGARGDRPEDRGQGPDDRRGRRRGGEAPRRGRPPHHDGGLFGRTGAGRERAWRGLRRALSRADERLRPRRFRRDRAIARAARAHGSAMRILVASLRDAERRRPARRRGARHFHIRPETRRRLLRRRTRRASGRGVRGGGGGALEGTAALVFRCALARSASAL